ncbi:MAG: DNA topoisomerase I [Candidatus Micrarchaeota archaeon]|nr:DNA topoisomerase I [Candidatus Micrarchaeota archaeon]
MLSARMLLAGLVSMKLVICEKPKVAEKIAHAIGRGRADRKSLNGTPYYEVERDGEKIVVVSAVGHLYTLRQGKGDRGYPVFDIEWAPTYEVDKDSDYSKKYLETIEKLAPGADEYICACDFDVEGSLIGYNVIRFACGSEIGSRMKFSALTDSDLEDAYVERGKLDVENALAGEARHKLDWFYGINLSRALMAAIRTAGASYGQTMSIGRVQGPALAILAKKEAEIAAFVSTPYWEAHCKAKETLFGHTRGRFVKQEEAKAALANSKSPGTVAKVEKKEYQQAPPPPFDLTSLQVEAHRMFGFAPARTLEFAQTLYEASLISYPRTSSQKLSQKLNLKRVIESLAKNPAYEKSAKGLLAENRLTPMEGKKEDPAHPAIHPTGLRSGVGEKEGKLYDLITKRFLACFGKPAVREAQKVEIASGSEKYSTNGNRTVAQGWFEIYAPYVKLEETTLPQFSEGESVPLSDFAIDEKKTQPPKRYTAASIISELERLGLGTKATRAAVIETLFKRNYLEGTASIKTTPFGMAVYGLLFKVAPEILDEELTHQIEDQMDRIIDGENERKAIEEGKRVLLGILAKFDGKEREIGFALLSGLRQKESSDSLLGKCVKCGNDLRMIKSKAGKQFVGCIGYPQCTETYPLPQEAKIIPLGKACEKCGTPNIRVVRKARKTFEMCINPNCETKKNWGARPATVLQAKAAPKPAAVQPTPTQLPTSMQAAPPITLQPQSTAKADVKKKTARPARKRTVKKGEAK